MKGKDWNMFSVASKIIFLAFLLRTLAAVAIVGAIGYGFYIAYHGLIVMGVIWVVSAVSIGWVGNMVFQLVYVLASAGAGPLIPKKTASPICRPLHTSFGARKSV
jgi:hypothetical protein